MELDDLQGSFQPKPFYELFPVVSLESVTPWHYNYLFFFKVLKPSDFQNYKSRFLLQTVSHFYQRQWEDF